MIKTLALTFSLFYSTFADDIKTLGAPNFACDAKVMAPSAKIPTNVNQVRFADIKIIGAIGDSLTAANGAGAASGDVLAVLRQFRGLSFHAGGQANLSEQITVPNVLKQFNPNLFGYALGIGPDNVWEVAQLNAGVPGAVSASLKGQAIDIVNKMKVHSEVDVTNDWKLVNLFIGGNDMCAFCEDKNATGAHSADHYRDNIKAAIQVLKDNLPRTIVSITGMLNLAMVRQIDKGQELCDGLHLFECPCESHQNFTNDDIDAACKAYQTKEQEIQDTGVFEADDFTVVIQPFFEDTHTPPMKNGKVDLTFFAPDCFHFSKFGHAVVAKNLWNTIVQPVGQKQRNVNLSDVTPTLSCPSADCPFFPTVKNSQNCAKLMTPSQLDV